MPTARYLQRANETREELPRILVVCEGEQTEPNYFRALAAEVRVSVQLKIVGLGDNTDSLVQQGIDLQSEDDYLQTWCVFDRDSFSAQHFNRALQLAASNGIRVAYSNEAFELWYLLHFEYLQTGLHRTAYREKLSQYFGERYKKNSSSMYRDLRSKQATAIQNARRLLVMHGSESPERANPSTTVHLLVQELQRLQR
jgi:hypothetical protein